MTMTREDHQDFHDHERVHQQDHRADHDAEHRADGDVIVVPGARTAWDVIEEGCIARLTGEMTLTTLAGTRTRVYVTSGLVYFAEHDTDSALSERLLVSGAIDRAQLERGCIRINGVEHLGRLFDRVPSVDRDAVELVVELATEDTLTDIAEQPLASYQTAHYRHHPSGIARWFSTPHAVEDDAARSQPVPAATENVTREHIASPAAVVLDTVDAVDAVDVVDVVDAVDVAPPVPDLAEAVVPDVPVAIVPVVYEMPVAPTVVNWPMFDGAADETTAASVPTLPLAGANPAVTFSLQALTPLYGGLQPLASMTPRESTIRFTPLTAPEAHTREVVEEPGMVVKMLEVTAPVQPVQTQPVQTQPVQTPPVQTPPVQIQTVQIQPVEPVQVEPVQVAPVQISPVQLAPTDVRAAPIRPTLPQASPARATADPTAPPNVVPDFGFIPVPEDVAAAVRRAINAIESAMATAATPAAVSFGTMHVTSAGHENTFDQRDDAGRNGAGATNGRGAKNEMNGMTILDKATVVSQSRPGAPIAGLELLGDPDQLLHNPQAAPIGTARRGALRRLIDGIRHRG